MEDEAEVALESGMRKRKRKWSAGAAASTFVGGIATNKIAKFLWKRKRGSESGGSGTKNHRFCIPG